MTKEFNLSKKVFRLDKLIGLFDGGDIFWNPHDEFVHIINIKEFIKKLKEDIWNMKKLKFITRENNIDLIKLINKHAGDKLI